MATESKLLYTPEAAAERLSVGRATVYELMRRGELGSVRLGRSRRIPADALADFVERLKAEAADARS